MVKAFLALINLLAVPAANTAPPAAGVPIELAAAVVAAIAPHSTGSNIAANTLAVMPDQPSDWICARLRWVRR